MKNVKFILPAVAFVLAIVTAYASIPASFVLTAAKGVNGGSCQSDFLDNNRTIGTSAGQCSAIEDDDAGVCTVTFGIATTVTAFTPDGTCDEDDEILYLQD